MRHPKFRGALLAAALTLAGAGCAAPQFANDAAERDCFRAFDVNNYSVIDDRRVRVTVSSQREYIFTVRQDTRNLDWTHAIAIRSATSFICTGNGLGVELMGGDPPLPYPVTNIEREPQEAPTGS